MDRWMDVPSCMYVSIFFYCRHEKGHPKYKGLCNVGFELPEAEIAAFHLHRYENDLYC